MEYWKDVEGFINYKVSTFGNVYSKALNKLFTLNPTNNYTVVKLYDAEKNPFRFNVHFLVANNFIKKPDDYDPNKHVIDHIDENKNNNNVKNLRWITPSGNSQAYHDNKPKHIILQYSMENELIKRWNSIDEILKENITYKRNSILANLGGTTNKCYNFKWKYETPPIKKEKDTTIHKDEKFLDVGTIEEIDFSLYEVSNFGKVRNTKTNLILSPGISTTGYYVVALVYYEIIDGVKMSIQSMQKVHRLVAHKFCERPDKIKNKVNHKDENKLNNHYLNLEWVTQKENMSHSMGKKVHQLDKETGKIIKTYNSLAEAQRAVNNKSKSVTCIRRVITGEKKSAYGFKWALAE